MEISVTTAEMPRSQANENRPVLKKEWFGLRVTTVTPEIAKQLGLAKAEGVVIEAVEMRVCCPRVQVSEKEM